MYPTYWSICAAGHGGMPGSGGGSAAMPPVCASGADLSLPLQGSDMIMEQMAQDLVGSKLPFVWPSLALNDQLPDCMPLTRRLRSSPAGCISNAEHIMPPNGWWSCPFIDWNCVSPFTMQSVISGDEAFFKPAVGFAQWQSCAWTCRDTEAPTAIRDR